MLLLVLALLTLEHSTRKSQKHSVDLCLNWNHPPLHRSFAQSNNLASSLNTSSIESDDHWIIDSEASDHMTGLSSLSLYIIPIQMRKR